MKLPGLRVLVVEDEALVSILVEDFLAEAGCEIIATASRLDDAMQKARSLLLDAAVLDLNLAGQISAPVAEILLVRNIPFIFATGYGPQGLPDGLRNCPVLAKPFQQGQLVEALSLATNRSIE